MAAIADDVLLRRVLELITVREMDLERFLTALRGALLTRAMTEDGQADGVLRLGCILARQCFINEYVFAAGADEQAKAGSLRHRLSDALAAGREAPALWLVAIARHGPLHHLADPASAARLAPGRSWWRAPDPAGP